MYVAVSLIMVGLCGLVSDIVGAKPGIRETAPEFSSCRINDRVYQHLERTPDPCNRCWCSNGVEACNRRGCPSDLRPQGRAPCVVGDRVYPHGQRTGDPCDRCQCFNGHELCTLNMCYIDGVPV
ncbi:unnamed protein product [Candidula unifasciata]|uniref:Uncharacterized protein n=1 Tax=Candidula unifasciata TaxID=100452 RepID=A0A8S3ZNR6_9EUPU|nr:unnamed protein product [Candidula unifasciata]